jgi:hypothetical protein
MKVKKNVKKKEHSIACFLFRGMIIKAEISNKSTSIEAVHFAIEM